VESLFPNLHYSTGEDRWSSASPDMSIEFSLLSVMIAASGISDYKHAFIDKVGTVKPLLK
jgi:hypothetical protein